MQAGLVSNIQKYSLHDGPGIRTTVFLKGCPLRCAWCHNPENISARPQVIVFKNRCVRCGACRAVCPQWSLRRNDPTGRLPADGPSSRTKTALASPESDGAEGSPSARRCLACGACVEACPTGARVMVGQRMTVPRVMEQILADRIFYDDSNGGVTFSGGEPLQQVEFLRAALRECRRRGLHTAVDTCGFAPRAALLSVAPLADLFLYDVKLMNERRHVKLCGASNRLILENLRALAAVHEHIWIRVPIIPGVNDGAAETSAMTRFLKTLTGVRQVNLLPYHRTGMDKFERLGKRYELADLAPPSPEHMSRIVERFIAAGLPASTP